MKRLFRAALYFLAPYVGFVGLGLAGCDVGETSDGGELVDVDPLDTDGDGDADLDIDLSGGGQGGQDGQDGAGTGGGQGGQGGEGGSSIP